ncbi:MAG TPA: Gfo/Idh/MocA family oxidoreductase [Chloroflexota bacterium]|nr:Gfo/Idh/MocA family oxidoreductase [Chloroflexota bacterium]
MKDIGLGVIGIGMGLSLAAINQEADSRLEVRALCATRRERLEAAARRWGIGFVTTDYRELIDRPDVQVVGVFSPDHLHAAHARAALEAGKHVICTKPMVTRVEDAAELVRLVDRTGLAFLVGQTMRFEPQFATAKRMLDDGELGTVAWAEAHYVHDLRHVLPHTPWRLSAPQDLMFGGVSHPVDLLRWLFGDVRTVHALGAKGQVMPDYPLLDNFLLNLQFEQGTIARVLGAYGVVHPPMPMMGLGLYGHRGSLQADFTDRLGGQVRYVLDKVETLPVATMTFDPEREGAYGHGQTVLRYLRHFEACLASGTQPSPGVRDGARSVATCAAAWESVRTGAVVTVRNDF